MKRKNAFGILPFKRFRSFLLKVFQFIFVGSNPNSIQHYIVWTIRELYAGENVCRTRAIYCITGVVESVT